MSDFSEKSPIKGVLLCNLGTPNAPDRKSVGRFLREFLSDPRVVDLPRWLWLPLLNLVIIPIRSGRSARAYREIWRSDGSPLLVLTERLAVKLAQQLGENYVVETGMRYGEPSIAQALEKLRNSGVKELNVLPLYPQFSGTTTASIYDAVEAGLAQMDWQPELRRVNDYAVFPRWVSAVTESIRTFQADHGKPEKLLFSLHGIPQRYAEQGDPYPRQCEQGVSLIARELGLEEDEWLLCYQSRVGREPWLMPYTDKSLQALAADGVRHVQVVCPGFAVDCLETLEEIAIENKELFIEAGGNKLEYIPALNDSETHANALAGKVIGNP